MYEALRLTAYRPGNLDRRLLLVHSRDKPCSATERKAHRLLRAARILGWTSNHPVLVAGSTYFIDIAFRGQRLAVEIDGRLHEPDSVIATIPSALRP